jgi:hypothetical protein
VDCVFNLDAQSVIVPSHMASINSLPSLSKASASKKIELLNYRSILIPHEFYLHPRPMPVALTLLR